MRLISRALLGLQLLVLALVVVAKAQEQKNPANQATVWASFVYTINGETNSNDVLTSKGADQGRKVGKMVRSRYLDGPESNITSAYRLKSVPKTRLSNAKVEIMSTEKEGNIGMATMFMKGLYPQKKDNNSDEVYPVIKALRDNDVDHFELTGAQSCPAHIANRQKYVKSSDFKDRFSQTDPFYQAMASKFKSKFKKDNMHYDNAEAIYDYAAAAYARNASFAKSISKKDIGLLRQLASRHIWDNNCRFDTRVTTVGGRALAGAMYNHLSNYVKGRRQLGRKPLKLLFGPRTTMMSFFSVAGLGHKPEFQQLPEPGSSMIVEVYTNPEVRPKRDPKKDWFPDVKDINVRFLFRNGTKSDAKLIMYSLFGFGPSKAVMKWKDFETQIEPRAIATAAKWCNLCNSQDIICRGAYYGKGKKGKGGRPTDDRDPISRVAAGGIGAASLFILFFLLFLVGRCVGTHDDPSSFLSTVKNGFLAFCGFIGGFVVAIGGILAMVIPKKKWFKRSDGSWRPFKRSRGIVRLNDDGMELQEGVGAPKPEDEVAVQEREVRSRNASTVASSDDSINEVMPRAAPGPMAPPEERGVRNLVPGKNFRQRERDIAEEEERMMSNPPQPTQPREDL